MNKKSQSKKELRKSRKIIKTSKKNLGDIFILNDDIFGEIFRKLDNSDLFFFLISSKIIWETYKVIFNNAKIIINSYFCYSSIPRLMWLYNLSNFETKKRYSLPISLIKPSTFNMAAKIGNVDVFDWLNDRRCIIFRSAYEICLKQGNVEAVSWMLDNKFSFSKDDLYNVGKSGSVSLLEFIIKRYNIFNHNDFKKIEKGVLINDKVELYKYCVNLKKIVSIDKIFELKKMIDYNCFSIIKYHCNLMKNISLDEFYSIIFIIVSSNKYHFFEYIIDINSNIITPHLDEMMIEKCSDIFNEHPNIRSKLLKLFFDKRAGIVSTL